MISKAAQSILRSLIQAERDQDHEASEIVCEGTACWQGTRRTSRRVVNELLRAGLLRNNSEAGNALERYALNEHGIRAAADRAYVPRGLLEALAERST